MQVLHGALHEGKACIIIFIFILVYSLFCGIKIVWNLRRGCGFYPTVGNCDQKKRNHLYLSLAQKVRVLEKVNSNISTNVLLKNVVLEWLPYMTWRNRRKNCWNFTLEMIEKTDWQDGLALQGACSQAYHLSSIPRTHMVERELTPSSHPLTCIPICIHMHTDIHECKINKNVKKYKKPIKLLKLLTVY